MKLMGLSLVGLIIACLYERLFPLKGELVSTTPLPSMTNPAPTFVVVDRLARRSQQNPLLNRMLTQRYDVTVSSAEISAEPYFHAN